MANARIISIEGNIGSGKTTLMSSLMNKYKDDKSIVFVREPVDEWENICDEDGRSMITKFYADQVTYAFAFQIMACATRYTILKQAIRENPQATIFITERSMHTDKCVFAKMLKEAGKMETVFYTIYCQLYETFVTDHTISSVIYVKASPEICHQRIGIRCRTGESNVPLDYLVECHLYHENMIIDLTTGSNQVSVLVVDGNVNIYRNEESLSSCMNTIHEFLEILIM